MRILHYHTSTADAMIADYVSTLCANMASLCQTDTATDAVTARQKLHSQHFDILHMHSCWDNDSARVASSALKAGVRLVITPHGQLEPWVQHNNYWREKLPKRLLYQRRIIRRAYAVIIQGRMEEECMRQLGWNSRMVVVRNSLVTSSITPAEMSRQTRLVYQRVMDSDTLQLMTDSTKSTLRQLLKIGVTGDERWLCGDPCIRITDDSQWRYLFCYARQEQVMDVVKRGIHVLNLSSPDIDVSNAPCFMPDGYEPSKTIESVIGNSFASENDRLLATFRHLYRLVIRHQLTLAHLVELDRELRYHDADEMRLNETLQERHLYKLTARVMQLMADLTGFDEGYMPMPPLDDRITRKIRKQIDNHLTI